MDRLTIYDIKRLTANTSSYFFSRASMRFFGQRLKDFKVYRQEDGRYKIIASSGKNWQFKHYTIRYFNPVNNKLESE